MRPTGAPHASVGSSSSSRKPRDAREVIDERRAKYGPVRIESHHTQQRRRASEVDARTAGTGTIDYCWGCLALRPSLRQVSWPTKFSPRVPAPYNGDTNPTSFLQVYSTAMAAAGTDHKVMANWFPLALGPLAQKWIMNQPEGSIRSWRDPCE